MREHEHERRPPEPQPRRPEPPRPLDGVLALQRSAGNQAVAAMLARQPVAEETRGGGSQRAAPGKATLTGIGPIEILSFGWEASSPTKKQEPRTECTFTSIVGEHSTKLQKALLEGKVMDVEVEIGSLKVKLLKAVIVSYSIGSESGGDEPTEQWSLSADSVVFGDGSGGGGGGGTGSQWDLGGPGG
jgi:hypothetical protein